MNIHVKAIAGGNGASIEVPCADYKWPGTISKAARTSTQQLWPENADIWARPPGLAGSRVGTGEDTAGSSKGVS
jgi:hypothetical protein